MRPIVMLALAFCLLVAVGCSQGATTSPRIASVPTPTPERAGEPVSVERLADGYIRALYAHDTALMQALFPTSKPDADRDEYHLRLEGLTVQRVTPAEVGDRNPVAGTEYARAEARVSNGQRVGWYIYTIGTQIKDGRRYIVSVASVSRW